MNTVETMSVDDFFEKVGCKTAYFQEILTCGYKSYAFRNLDGLYYGLAYSDDVKEFSEENLAKELEKLGFVLCGIESDFDEIVFGGPRRGWVRLHKFNYMVK